MNEYLINLNEQELMNLKVFLSRTNLTGSEANEFMKLTIKINNAEVVKKDGK